MSTWKDYQWYETTFHAPLPSTAIMGGHEDDGTIIYVGRIQHEGELLPAKIIPSRKLACAPYEGKEIFKDEFEILLGTGFSWVSAKDGSLPTGVLEAGRTENDEPLYIGRVQHDNSLLVGKIDPVLRCLCVTLQGKEYSCTENYEVLVQRKIRTRWQMYAVGDTIMEDAILVGFDADGAETYVGRAHHNLELLPAKVIPKKNVAYVSFEGCEYPKYGVEVLCGGSVFWVPSSLGQALPGAVVGGRTSDGEDLYIGRVKWDYAIVSGKIQQSRQRLFISCGGYEIAQRSYEILIEEIVHN